MINLNDLRIMSTKEAAVNTMSRDGWPLYAGLDVRVK